MKKHLKLLTLLILLVSQSITSKAQLPQKMGFQAVIRDAANTLIANQPIAMRVSILQGSVTGTSVYTETHTTTTNINGLVTLEIGTGSVVSGVFASINWANGPYFIKTETDPNGGTNYSIISTSQLLSVPYAFHARTADSILNPISNNIQYVVKKNDETRNSDTTITNDSELIFSLEAGGIYSFQFFIMNTTTVSGDFKFTLNYTGAATLRYFPFWKIPGITSTTSLSATSITTIGNVIGPNSAGGQAFIEIKGSINCITAGTFGFGWAQRTSDVGPTTVFDNSYGILFKVN
jgi:hypothetical protein